MIDSPITRARLAEKALRFQFEAKKEQEWLDVSAEARATISQSVIDARDRGTSVAQIAREYGTKDRGTIYRIINSRKDFVALMGGSMTGSTLTVVSNPTAHATGGYPDDWTAWTATVQAWDDFRRPDALSALEKTDSDNYSGWLTFCVRSNNSIHIIEAEHSGSPLHKEIIAWQDDSPLVQQIKTQMEAEK